jgi:hypothetical protein
MRRMALAAASRSGSAHDPPGAHLYSSTGMGIVERKGHLHAVAPVLQLGAEGMICHNGRNSPSHRLGQRDARSLAPMQRDEARLPKVRIVSTRLGRTLTSEECSTVMSRRSATASISSSCSAGKRAAWVVSMTSCGPAPVGRQMRKASTMPSGFCRCESGLVVEARPECEGGPALLETAFGTSR